MFLTKNGFAALTLITFFGSSGCSQPFSLAVIPNEAQFEIVSAPSKVTGLSANDILSLSKLDNFPLGRQPLGTRSTYKVYLRNIGDLAGTVQKVSLVSLVSSTSSDIFSVAHDCAALDGHANQICPITLSFEPDSLGEVQTTVEVEYENGKAQTSKITLPIKASASNLAFLKFETELLDFKTDTIGYSVTSRLKVIYNGAHLKTNGLTIKPAMGVSFSDPTDGQFTLDPATTTCGTTIADDCLIGMKFSATSAGVQSAKFYLSYFNGSENLKITGQLTGTGVTAVTLASLSAPATGFGPVVMNPLIPKTILANVTFTGSIPAEQVQITSPTGSAFTLDSNPAVSTCMATTSISANCVLSISFNPTNRSAYSDTIKISYNSNGQGRDPLTIVLSGTGANPALISFTTASTLSFSTTPAHLGKAMSLTLKNTGEINAANLSALTLSNSTDFQAALTGCGNLAPNATCTLNVTFNPQTAQARSTTLAFTYLDGRATQTITASAEGTGTAPVVILNPSKGTDLYTLDFGNVLMGSAANSINTQTATLGIFGTTSITTASQLVITPTTLSSPFSFAGGGTFPGTSGTCNIILNPNSNSQCSFITSLTTTATGLTADVQAFQTFTLGYTGDAGQGSGTLSFKLAMTPRIPPTLSFVSPAASLGTLAANDSTNVTYTIKNNSPYFSAPISGITLAGGPAITLTSNGCPAALAPSATCQVTVTFNPTTASTFNGSLTVNYSDQLNAQTTSTSFSGVGSGNVKLIATPTTIDFGNVFLGDTIPTKTIALKYFGLNSWTPTFTASAPFTIDASACGSPADCNLTISYNPPVAGTSNISSKLTYSPAIVPDSSGSDSAAITLTLKGRAATRTASLTLTPLSFKKTLIGSTLEQDLVLKNTGSADAKDLAFSLPSTTPMPFAILTGPDSTFCNNLTVLANNQTCKIRLSFTPSKVGSTTAIFSASFTDVGQATTTTTPFTLAAIGTAPIQVFANAFQTCIINELQKAVCWGNNAYGQLGRSNTNVLNQAPQSLTPISFGSAVTAVKKLAPGVSHVCALVETASRTGAVSCWGNNDRGRLGMGSASAMSTQPSTDGSGNPIFVNLGTDSSNNPLEASDISVGFEHSCAVLKNGKVKCWGGNSSGQLGIGNTTSAGLSSAEMGNGLQAVDLRGIVAIQVSAGAGHTCAVLVDGNTKCWGDNFYGQLGQGSGATALGTQNGDLFNLKNIDLGAGVLASSILTSQGAFTCALLATGKIKCFGKTVANEESASPFFGVLGSCWARSSYNSSAVPCSSSPSFARTHSLGYYASDMGDNLPAVSLGLGSVLQLASGNHFNCVLLADHSVRCWGMNDRGQLGIGSTLNIGASASEMGTTLGAALSASGGVQPTAVAAGAEHACAAFSNNTLKCWGGPTDNATGLKAMGFTGDQHSASSVPNVYDGNN